MTNPFSDKPTIVDEVDDDTQEGEQPDPTNPVGVQEDYDYIEREVIDEDDLADLDWSQTPVSLYAVMDSDDFWWVVVRLEDRLTDEKVQERTIPYIVSRHEEYDDFVDAREEVENTLDGIHVQSKNSNKIRYVKGDDRDNLINWRDDT